MGVEYRLRFDATEPEVIARLPGASRTSDPATFHLGQGPATCGMPDAEVRLEPDGAYFCCYGGSGRERLGVLIASLVDRFGTVAIEDWE